MANGEANVAAERSRRGNEAGWRVPMKTQSVLRGIEMQTSVCQ